MSLLAWLWPLLRRAAARLGLGTSPGPRVQAPLLQTEASERATEDHRPHIATEADETKATSETQMPCEGPPLLDETWLKVLSFFSPADLCRVGPAQSKLQSLTNDEDTWKSLCQDRWRGKQWMKPGELFRNGNSEERTIDAMGSLFERLWPDAHWWLRVCHLEHLVEFSFLRLMLFIGSVISGVFGLTWLLDVMELRCFENKPWTQEGAGKYTCSVKFLGGLMMLMMFWHSVMALIHFDKNLDRLKQDRKQCIDDMNSQIGVALTHATSQAKRLCELLEIQLVQQVRGHIHKMRNILQKCEQFCPEEFSNLVELMGNHLHCLRKPAMKKFEKLVLAFNQEAVFYDLTQTLRQQKQTSMVKLLTIQSEHARGLQLPRTKTAHDPEAARPLLDQDQQLAQGIESWCSSISRGYRKKRRTSKTPTSSLAQVAFSHDEKLKELLQEPTEEDMRSKPEAVLLRPVSLVLNYFEKIQPFVHGEPLHAEDEEVTIGTPSQEENPYVKQANKVYVHLTDSPLYVSVLVGVVCSVALLLFHFHMAIVVLHVIRTGDHCSSLGMWSCSMELVRVITVMTGMLCHTVSLLVILWNVDKLDQVLELTEDIKEFKKTKDQIESLNKNDLADKDLDMKTLEDAHKCLQGQSGIVDEFFLRHTGQQLDVGDFRSFMEELRDALPCDEKPCSITLSRAGTEYTALPSEESETGAGASTDTHV
eukprot:s176_g29.t1